MGVFAPADVVGREGARTAWSDVMTYDISTSLRRLADVMLVLFIVSLPIICWAVELGGAVTASHVFGLGLIVVASWIGLRTRRRPTLDLASVSLLGFAAVATLTVAMLWRQPELIVAGESTHHKAVKQIVGLYFSVTVFFSLRYVMEATGAGLKALRAYYVTTFVVAGLSLVQYGVAQWDLQSPFANFSVYNSTLGETRALVVGNSRYGFPRVALTLVEPSRLSMYLLTGWALWAYGVTRHHVVFLGQRWMTVTGILIGTAVLVTGSRLGYVSLGALALGALVLRPDRGRRLAVMVGSVALATLLIGPAQIIGLTATLLPTEPAPGAISPVPAPSRVETPKAPAQLPRGEPHTPPSVTWVAALEQRLLSVGARSDMSVRHRIGSVLVVLSVLRDHPWLGVGYGISEFAMAARYPAQMGVLTHGKPNRPSLMSLWGTIVAETGVIGLAWVLGFIVGTYGVLVSLRHSAHGRVVAWAVGGALVAYAISASVKSIEIYQFLIVWFLLAIALVLPSAIGTSDPAPHASGRMRGRSE